MDGILSWLITGLPGTSLVVPPFTPPICRTQVKASVGVKLMTKALSETLVRCAHGLQVGSTIPTCFVFTDPCASLAHRPHHPQVCAVCAPIQLPHQAHRQVQPLHSASCQCMMSTWPLMRVASPYSSSRGSHWAGGRGHTCATHIVPASVVGSHLWLTFDVINSLSFTAA